ncbi:(2Fe-2S)-binding protein [Caballeronia mineralivorans]|jgi:carbon-monoxide dehydrogenase small subunit|uniref:(2Fe-2S)-binding protein n=1 Tax=Caballeronia mineralivorans TaxID=2010198 RepID=UPI002B000847|nr:(2Fe-2S)-binding protein [Caballeronia mineralivorans]MEA3105150.1 aerobic carbon-monoxide dehydrogenase small subunit [Caballeronia mineralivorans]
MTDTFTQAVQLVINRETVNSTVSPRTHLADFLREQQMLCGTNIGCEQGVCGACTVMIDGVPARSCITPAIACAGSMVLSIEGFDDDATMNALRTAFSAEHALQCGYCTPGMLITALDIVTRLPGVDDDRVRLELSGNLCRCTGYAGIVRAIRRVLDAQREQTAAPIARATAAATA